MMPTFIGIPILHCYTSLNYFPPSVVNNMTAPELANLSQWALIL